MTRLVLSGRTARQPIRDALSNMPGIELVEADTMAEVVDEIGRADALILSDPRGPDGASLVQALHRADSRVRWIQMVSAGYSGVVSHPLPPGVIVTNQGGVAAPAVAEHALALILALNRALPEAMAAQRVGRWDPEPVRTRLRTLEGATVIIVGVGHVGATLAKMLSPFGARRLGVTRDGKPRPDFEQTMPIAALEQALGEADIVVICLPASAETRGLFDTARMGAIRPGTSLVNVGRGEVVEAGALATALLSGHLRGAAIDVTDPEPLPDGHPLWEAPNLIITPHVAGGGNPRSGQRIAAMVAENAARFVRGEPLLNRIHLETRA